MTTDLQPIARRRGRRRLIVGLVAAMVAVLALPVPAGAQGAPEPAPAPAPAEASASAVRTDTVQPALTAVPAAEAPAPPVVGAPESAGGRKVTGEQTVAPFTLIGVGFASPSGGAGSVRTRTDGTWSGWKALDLDPSHAADGGGEEAVGRGPANRTGAPLSEPIWVGRADAYQLDLPADATGVEVLLVRETGEAIATDGATEAMTAPGEAGGAEAAGEPSVRLRSSWGARPYRGTPDVHPYLQRAYVHHTVNSNSYSQAQVPALLRSVQAYHQDGRGWDDIGYNFVIDRFGAIWEGRAGGIRNAVIGAHTMDHNTGAVGIAYLGDATSSVSSAAVASYGRLIGWKLFLGGVRPSSSNVMGHRDAGQTSCPGNALYARLGSIRSAAVAVYDDLVGPGRFTGRAETVNATFTPLAGDFDGDAYDDVLWYGPGGATDKIWWGGPSGFTSRALTVNGTYRPVVGDFNGDDRSDVFWYAPGAAADQVWYGGLARTFTSKAFTVGGDFQPVAGDFDGDGEGDVLWYGAGAARDNLWRGTSSENFTDDDVTVNGTFVPAVGDFDGDDRSDVLWYGPGGEPDRVWYGASNGFSGKTVTVNGTFVPLVADVTGGGRDDVLWYGAGAATDRLWVAAAGRVFSPRSITVNGTFDRPVTGDWNADGRDDLLWYATGTAPDKVWIALT